MTRLTMGIALVGALTWSCLDDSESGSGPDGPEPPVETDTDALAVTVLEDLGAGVVAPAYVAFADAADALVTAMEAYTDGGDIDAARAAFDATMTAWQTLEVYQIGPAARASSDALGQALRDEVYSWPTSNPCRVDQKVVVATDEDVFDGALVNAYGLDALEYLLFNQRVDNACPPQVRINSDGTWDMLGDAEIGARRATYGLAVARRVARTARALADIWTPSGEDFGARLGAGGDSPYGSTQATLNAVFAAMFYIDGLVKDRKLADVAGISMNCTEEQCPDAAESQWAGRSVRNVAANLRAVRALMTGTGEDTGFVALLEAQGAKDLAETMIAALDAAISTADGLPPNLAQVVVDDVSRARELHARVKVFTDLLKSQFVTVLNLSVPQEGAADND